MMVSSPLGQTRKSILMLRIRSPLGQTRKSVLKDSGSVQKILCFLAEEDQVQKILCFLAEEDHLSQEAARRSSVHKQRRPTCVGKKPEDPVLMPRIRGSCHNR